MMVLMGLCLAALSVQAQDTTAVCPPGQVRQICECGCHRRPVNDYEGLRSLWKRLANPRWDGSPSGIGTGLKLEDGRISPLSPPFSREEAGEPVTSSGSYAGENADSVNPFLVGGFSIRHQMSVKEVNRTYIVQKPTSPDVFFADDREWGTMTYLGIYASAGVHIGHIRLSATFDYPFGGKKGPQAKGSAIVGIAYRL